MSTHSLKIAPVFFDAVSVGLKTSEVSKCSDRVFRVGDYLVLRDFNEGQFTGDRIIVEVTHILNHGDFPCGINRGYCVISFELVRVHAPNREFLFSVFGEG